MIAFSLIHEDRHLERWIVGHRVSWLNWLFEELSRIGAYGMVWLAIALVLAVVRRRPRIFVLVLAADAVADLLAGLLKAAIPRVRPHLHPLVHVPASHSFPSGHTATSFACATALAAIDRRLALPAFVLAAAIGYSRLYNGVHWPLDVLGGAVLGVLVARVLTALLPRAARRRGSRRGSRAG